MNKKSPEKDLRETAKPADERVFVGGGDQEVLDGGRVAGASERCGRGRAGQGVGIANGGRDHRDPAR